MRAGDEADKTTLEKKFTQRVRTTGWGDTALVVGFA